MTLFKFRMTFEKLLRTNQVAHFISADDFDHIKQYGDLGENMLIFKSARLSQTIKAALFCIHLTIIGAAFESAAGEVSYRYFRFTPTKLRNDNSANSVQLAEFQILLRGQAISGAVASNPGGDNPGGEQPLHGVDGDTGTKWLDFNKGALILDFTRSIFADSYRWATANDATSRDAVRWILEGSKDNSTWNLLDDQSSTDFPTPTDRFTWLSILDFKAVPDVPIIQHFAALKDGLESENGLAINSGETVTLFWRVTGSDQISIDQATPAASGESGEIRVSPTTTTTYTLTASNTVGDATASLTIIVDAELISPVITEFLANNGGKYSAFDDEDGQASDWIEIHNPNPVPIRLEGHFLTDESELLNKWPFPPSASIEGGGYLIVFASGKDRRDSTRELHTNFKLTTGGEYLAFSKSEGTTLLQAFEPTYPIQYENISYGRVPGNTEQYDYFENPTSGSANSTTPGLPVLEQVVFSMPSQTFSGSLSLSLSTEKPEDAIRYTINGSIPTASSTRFNGHPLTLNRTTQIRARVFRNGNAPGPISSGTWTSVDPQLSNFDSNLPIIILDNFDSGSVTTGSTPQSGFLNLLEPNELGRTDLVGIPSDAHRMGFKRRGSSTMNDPKGNYRIEFRQEGTDEDLNVELLGLSKHTEWILFAPYRFDRSLVRIPFIHQLSLDIGQYAPRSVFVEVFLSTANGRVGESDYQGVYVLQERISRDKDRVDIDRLDSEDISEPEVSGGYILSIDRRDSGESGFRSALGHPEDPAIAGPQPWFNFIYPKEKNILPQQKDYIKGYIDDFEAALYGQQFRNPVNGYANWIDVASFIDHHILVTFTKDPDALRLSTFFHKPRNEPLKMGPIWDFDRTMGCDSDGRSSNPVGWDPPNETAQFFIYDWWGRLFQDPDFYQAWIDRWQTLRVNEMSKESLLNLVDTLASQVSETQDRNFDRWPENRPNGGSFSSLAGWNGEIGHLQGWLERRADWIDSQFPSVPIFNHSGGELPPNSPITMRSSGNTVYYTMDGSDPRVSGGGIADQAIPFEGGSITKTLIGAGAELKARIPSSSDSAQGIQWTELNFDDSSWQGGNGGIGFDEATTYDSQIDLDLNSQMNGVNTSVFVRYEFNLQSPQDIETLNLRMKYDDGFVAWLNGQRIADSNFSSANPVWNSAATGQNNDSAAVIFESFNVLTKTGLLKTGKNVLAIQGLNANLTSSDFLIVPELVATELITESSLALNETTQITARSFNGKDWSAPARSVFVVGESANSSNLVISELHYHPSSPTEAEIAEGFTDSDDFEFIELMNVGDQIIDLSGIHFSAGIEFEFFPLNDDSPLLKPGERMVLASNLAAFVQRYGNRAEFIQIGGEYLRNLSNSGESIILLAADDSIIRSFTYDDTLPWPEASDGDGPSLVMVNPTSTPIPDHNNATTWKAGDTLDGTPGGAETGGSDDGPLADLNRNGIPDFVDYAFGNGITPNKNDVLPYAFIDGFMVDGINKEFLTVRFQKNLEASEISYLLQSSTDLRTWSSDQSEFVFVESLDQKDGTTLETYRSASPVTPGAFQFARILIVP
jgi:hypothetical protein